MAFDYHLAFGFGRSPVWRKYTVTYADLAAAALTATKTLFQLPPAGVIHATKIKHSVQFAGGAISSYTISVGISGTPAKYGSAYQVGTTTVGDTAFNLTVNVNTETHGANTAIIATATSVGANTNAATAGSADIWVLWSRAN